METTKKFDFMTMFRKYGMFLILILLLIFFAIMSNSFFTVDNILNIARQASYTGIAAVGMTFVLLLGGIDLSIGSNITLVNVLAAWLMIQAGWAPLPACLIAIAVSTGIGFFNGWIIAKIKIAPLIVTLSTMTIVEGVAYLISGGLPIFGFPEEFAVLGQGYFLQIPIPILVMIVVLAVGAFILNKTYFGRYFYAVGSNEEASKLSGINTERVKYLVYTLSGLFAAIAGIVILSRTNSGQVSSGKGFEFTVLTACVVGGVSVIGGKGKIYNIVLGIFIIGVLMNGMVQLNVSQYLQMVIKGAVLLAAVAFDSLQKNRQGKIKTIVEPKQALLSKE